MLHVIRNLFSPTNPLRLLWHFLWSVIFAVYYRFPGKNVVIIGVTGTNGKTTTSNLIAGMLETAGHSVALATTANFQIGKKKWMNETKFTTLGRGGIYKFLKDAERAGCTHAVIEVSSHALTQHRTFGIDFDAAVLTNISPEHLDFHGTMAEYIEAKTKLFWQLMKTNKPGERVAVLPAEDEATDYFRRVPLEGIIEFGLKKGNLRASGMQLDRRGQKFEIAGWGKPFELSTQLLGGFNVANILAASACCLGLGVQPAEIKKSLRNFAPVPGRLEPIDGNQPFRVIVDFAHTADALEKVIRTFRPITAGKIWTLYGACGDRDRSLRAPRGRVLDRLADEIIITTDDPYFEDEQQTIDDVLKGINRTEHLFVSLDRKEAMQYALAHAQAGDTVLLCGKGCETVRPTKGKMMPWDDRAVAREILKRLYPKKKRATKKPRGSAPRRVKLS